MSEEASVTNRPVWKAESQDQAKADAVRDGLREIMDPEIGLSIIELGLVRDLEFQPDKTWLQMIMTTPFCPYGPALLEMTRRKAEELSSAPTTIEMGMDMWDPSMMEEGAGAEWGLF
jgi:metal-sulfur cluster biosynthetic enzyme